MCKEPMKILIAMVDNPTSATFLTEKNMEALNKLGTVIWDKSVDIDICVCCWGVPKFDAFVLEKANKLKFIGYLAGSVANVTSDEMYDRGIRISCGNEMFAQSVAECTVAYMLCAQRDLRKYNNITNAGGWKESAFTCRSLIEKEVGVVGYGAISRYLLEMLKPFHVNIKLYSKHMTEEKAAELGVQKASLEEIFSTCDIVSVNTSKTPENHHLVNDTLLSMMPQDALLVNTARGAVIDEAALEPVVQAGKISAILDVFEVEPLPMDSKLRGLENVIIVPHDGGPTIDVHHLVTLGLIDDIRKFFNGETVLENEISVEYAKNMTNNTLVAKAYNERKKK